ncbi:MAG: DUF488 domain-containing protein [Planctomycetaceae bacterium]|nr:DUF488 domain-containing protein [Planctomycetaceae bacterium]
MEIFTIGFTQSTAERFFGRLKRAGLRQLMDIRLNNRSQLAGFAKQDDLKFFLESICGMAYRHEPLLAPTQDILDAYKKNGGQWSVYEEQFMALMRERQVETKLSPEDFSQPTVLLCSEATADQCHRRLVVEYLQQHWPDVKGVHL